MRITLNKLYFHVIKYGYYFDLVTDIKGNKSVIGCISKIMYPNPINKWCNPNDWFSVNFRYWEKKADFNFRNTKVYFICG